MILELKLLKFEVCVELETLKRIATEKLCQKLVELEHTRGVRNLTFPLSPRRRRRRRCRILSFQMIAAHKRPERRRILIQRHDSNVGSVEIGKHGRTDLVEAIVVQRDELERAQAVKRLGLDRVQAVVGERETGELGERRERVGG